MIDPVLPTFRARHPRVEVEGRHRGALERYAPTVPGFFLYFPSVAQRSASLRLFVEAAKELAIRAVK